VTAGSLPWYNDIRRWLVANDNGPTLAGFMKALEDDFGDCGVTDRTFGEVVWALSHCNDKERIMRMFLNLVNAERRAFIDDMNEEAREG
jgi:hypothetical protein